MVDPALDSTSLLPRLTLDQASIFVDETNGPDDQGCGTETQPYRTTLQGGLKAGDLDQTKFMIKNNGNVDGYHPIAKAAVKKLRRRLINEEKAAPKDAVKTTGETTAGQLARAKHLKELVRLFESAVSSYNSIFMLHDKENQDASDDDKQTDWRALNPDATLRSIGVAVARMISWYFPE
jgi:hypothetical protein